MLALDVFLFPDFHSPLDSVTPNSFSKRSEKCIRALNCAYGVAVVVAFYRLLTNFNVWSDIELKNAGIFKRPSNTAIRRSCNVLKRRSTYMSGRSYQNSDGSI